jgi:hypothetical protein
MGFYSEKIRIARTRADEIDFADAKVWGWLAAFHLAATRIESGIRLLDGHTPVKETET